MRAATCARVALRMLAAGLLLQLATGCAVVAVTTTVVGAGVTVATTAVGAGVAVASTAVDATVAVGKGAVKVTKAVVGAGN